LQSIEQSNFSELIANLKLFCVHYTDKNFTENQYSDILEKVNEIFVPAFIKFREKDMGVEMSVIKDNKGDSGIIGFTRRGEAVTRWSLTRNIVGEYARNMNLRFNNTNSANNIFVHEQEKNAKLQQDEKDVHLIYNHIIQNMSDPFDITDFNSHLINISSGVVANDEVENFLLNSVKIGYTMLKNFVSKRLDSQNEVEF
ncbi:hypothetical protein PV326_002189, partial [Microctonus aethiopoides]